MNIDINIGDILLGGRFKNKRIKVKSLGTDKLGQPIFNKKPKLLSVRIEKTLPEDMKSSKTREEKMGKKAYVEEIYNSAFSDELDKIGAAEHLPGTDAGVFRPNYKFVRPTDILHRQPAMQREPPVPPISSSGMNKGITTQVAERGL